MRDHNSVTLSGILPAAPKPFHATTVKSCFFSLVSYAEWKNTSGEFDDRFDEIPVRAHGPAASRALRLETGSHVLVTAELRTALDGGLFLNAKTIQLLTNVDSGK